jgi:hypothetical protein
MTTVQRSLRWKKNVVGKLSQIVNTGVEDRAVTIISEGAEHQHRKEELRQNKTNPPSPAVFMS